MAARWPLVLAVALAAAYGIAGGLLPALPAAALQASGIVVLAAYAFRLSVPDAPLFAAGLLASAVGDMLMNLAPMAAGLSAFLIAHLIYLAVFARALQRAGPRRGAWPIPALVLLAAAVLALPVWLWDGLGAMAAPVVAYAAAIGAMAGSAILAPSRGAALPAGALLFVASDSLIAANAFKGGAGLPDILFDPGIWITYVAAQLFLTLGFQAMRIGRAEARV